MVQTTTLRKYPNPQIFADYTDLITDYRFHRWEGTNMKEFPAEKYPHNETTEKIIK